MSFLDFLSDEENKITASDERPAASFFCASFYSIFTPTT